MTDRLYAPAIRVEDARVPISDLATALQAEVVSLGGTHFDFAPATCGQSGFEIITWPMDADTMLRCGLALLQYLHIICTNGHEDDPNLFLATYHARQGNSADLPCPAEEITAVLLVSDDQGVTWQDIRRNV